MAGTTCISVLRLMHLLRIAPLTPRHATRQTDSLGEKVYEHRFVGRAFNRAFLKFLIGQQVS